MKPTTPAALRGMAKSKTKANPKAPGLSVASAKQAAKDKMAMAAKRKPAKAPGLTKAALQQKMVGRPVPRPRGKK